jgi:hypothetical protein
LEKERAQGTGNPNKPLERRSKKELYNLAAEIGISGRSKLKKDDLFRAIRSAR